MGAIADKYTKLGEKYGKYCLKGSQRCGCSSITGWYFLQGGMGGVTAWYFYYGIKDMRLTPAAGMLDGSLSHHSCRSGGRPAILLARY